MKRQKEGEQKKSELVQWLKTTGRQARGAIGQRQAGGAVSNAVRDDRLCRVTGSPTMTPADEEGEAATSRLGRLKGTGH